VAVAKSLLRDYSATDGLFPSQHLPSKREAARARYADVIESAGGWLGPSDEMVPVEVTV
jgi:acyl-CoA dehydrogenase